MLQPVATASTILALTGTSFGFIVSQLQIQPNEFIEPSFGAFYNYYNGAWIDGVNLVLGYAGNWRSYRNYISSSSWLALDRWGGDGDFFGVEHGPGPPVHAPEWNGRTAYDLGGGRTFVSNDLGTSLISGIDGGPSGYVIGLPSVPELSLSAPSAISPVNGTPKDSIFFGNFILTESSATLVGDDLVFIIDGVDHFLPVDGTPGTSGFYIEYETFVAPANGLSGIRAFLVAPAPGSATLLAGFGFVAAHRRRAPR